MEVMLLVAIIISSEDSDQTRTMHSKSENVKILIDNEPDEIIEKLFDSLLQRHQKRIEEKIRGSELIFDSVDLLHYKLH